MTNRTGSLHSKDNKKGQRRSMCDKALHSAGRNMKRKISEKGMSSAEWYRSIVKREEKEVRASGVEYSAAEER